MKTLDIIFLFLLLTSCFNAEEKNEKLIFTNVDANDFLDGYNSKNSIILDVRTSNEISRGHIQDATFIDFYSKDFDEKIKIINKELTVHVYCKSGGRSENAAKKLIEIGFSNVLNLNGGFDSWKNNNMNFILPKNIKEATISQNYNLDSLNFIIKKNPTILYFYTKWCSPCKTLTPIVEKIQSDFKNNLEVVFINADIYPDLLKRFQVPSVPSIIFFQDNIISWQRIGLISYEELFASISKKIVVS